MSAKAKQAYIASAKRLAEDLESDDSRMAEFLRGYHKMGIHYFDPGSIDGYISTIESRTTERKDTPYTPEELEAQVVARIHITPDNVEEFYDAESGVRVSNKKKFLKELEKEGIEPPDDDEISGDDVHRHDVIVNTVTGEVLPVNGHTIPDYTFTWPLLDQFVQDHPDGKLIVVHGDGSELTVLIIPIPTLTPAEKEALQTGGGRRRRTRRQRRNI